MALGRSKQVLLRRRHRALLVPEERLFARAYRQQMALLRDASKDRSNPFAIAPWKRRVARALQPVYDGIIKRAGRIYIQDLFASGRKSAWREIEKAGGQQKVKDGIIRIERDLMERLAGTVDTVYSAVSGVVTEAVEDGLDAEEIAALVEQEWDDILGNNVDAVAATEANGAINSINDYLAQVMVELQHWITAKDERVRPTHVIYGESEARPVGFNWADLSDGNYTLRFPADPACDEASEVVFCRCFMAPAGLVEIPDDELADYLSQFDMDREDLLLSEEQITG